MLLLDNDAVALRNLDDLLHGPHFRAPAAVFGWKCYPRRELRSSTLVLAPSADDFARARELVHAPLPHALYDDNGDGAVWRRLYSTYAELPAGYAALRSADLSATEWAKVSVIHDPNLMRKSGRAGWRDSAARAALSEIDAEAKRAFAPFEAAVRQARRGGAEAVEQKGRPARPTRARRRGRRSPRPSDAAQTPPTVPRMMHRADQQSRRVA